MLNIRLIAVGFFAQMGITESHYLSRIAIETNTHLYGDVRGATLSHKFDIVKKY